MIYSFVSQSEIRGFSGVWRFDEALRSAFPDVRSITDPAQLDAHGALVIANNHLSTLVPDDVNTIVVHHGCAATHYVRDPAWRNERNLAIVNAQAAMFDVPSRIYMAPSSWVADEFARRSSRPYFSVVIPYWVPRIDRIPTGGKPLIIGDWRDFNKGITIWKQLARMRPDWQFSPLAFSSDRGRREIYGKASVYLCLSLSEGGAYAVCDAEAAELPIVSTDVGNYREFDALVIPWQKRENLQVVIETIERALKGGRSKPSFYDTYTYEVWRERWDILMEMSWK